MRLVSMTQQLRDHTSPISAFMSETFPTTRPLREDFRRQLEGALTIRPSDAAGPPPHATIGLAIDYRIGYYIRETFTRKLGAFDGARYMCGVRGRLGDPWSEEVFRPVAPHIPFVRYPIPKLASDFFDRLEDLLHRLRPVGRRIAPEDELELCRYCYVLALLDVRLSSLIRDDGILQRSPLATLAPGATVDDLLGLANPEWVKDMARMSWLFYERHANILRQKVHVHPNIIQNHGLVGAEPDLLLNGCVVDIKTTVSPELPTLWLYQVLAYVLTDTTDGWHIGGAGFYLARQGRFVRWPLNRLLPTVTGSDSVALPVLREQFSQVLRRVQRGG
jgi:hypothetical protein